MLRTTWQFFDEAHKLSADREPDLSIRKTDRYRLAEALAGIQTVDPRWSLNWSAHHLLLLTATPHMGRDFPYFCLWRLLEPEVLSTYDAFAAYPPDARLRHFLRRTKEEMVTLDGKPLYPERVSDTLSYELTQGEISERALYDQTTAYIQTFYNRARILNRQAAAMAMGVFQRRLASSTYALMRSFERRIAKLDVLIGDIRSGKLSPQDLLARQRQLGNSAEDLFDDKTGDEEAGEAGREENEVAEEKILGGVVAVNLTELEAERVQVQSLLELARKIYDKGDESKFDKLREILRDPRFKDEKLLIFTEHRDTLEFILRRLEGMGFGGQVAQIHGGMDYVERQEQVDLFRRSAHDGGATYMVCTDAAAEGINLQFCWLMVNWDVPWNPARLEQRMGRIHRYGQKRDKVFILNLVAGKTREGRVLKTLLDKMKTIREQLGSDKVFDVVGRLFEGVSLKQYMERALSDKGADEAVDQIEYTITAEQIEAIEAREKRLYGDGGDVKRELPRLRRDIEHELYRKLLPGYVRAFIERAAPLLGLEIVGDVDGTFSFRSQPGEESAMDELWPVLESYSPYQRQRLTVYKPQDKDEAIFLHPGELLFERIRACVTARFSRDALKGAVFVDPDARRPYLLHLASISVVRKAHESLPALAHEETLDSRLLGFKQLADGTVETCPTEHLLLLRPGAGVPVDALQLAAAAADLRQRSHDYARDAVAVSIADRHKRELVDSLAQRADYISRGFDFQDAELAASRSKMTERARGGDPRAKGDLTKVKDRQRQLLTRRKEALATLRREPELVVPGEVTFIAHALVVPSSDPLDKLRLDADVEAIAMRVARAYEEAAGAEVKDVSQPLLARAVGLDHWPGFDLLSLRGRGEARAIEVKGCAATGGVEISENEWSRACNLRNRYWLYVAFDCASPQPRLLRIQDPFGKLIVQARGGFVVDQRSLIGAAERDD